MKRELVRTYLDCRRRPLLELEGAESLHREICELDVEFYLDLLADAAADVSHRRAVLGNLLTAPAGASVSKRDIVARLRDMPTPEALRVLETLRDLKVNGRRARDVGLAYLVGHPQLREIAATSRQRLLRLFKHFLGERTWSSVCRLLNEETNEAGRFLRRTLLRHATDEEAAREALRFLAGIGIPGKKLRRGILRSFLRPRSLAVGAPTDPCLAKSLGARSDIAQGEGLPRDTLFGLRGTFHPDCPAKRVRYLARAPEPLRSQDGPLTALYKSALGEGEATDLRGELERRVERMVKGLPTIDACVAVILDLSGSTASSGARANHPAALGLALARCLRELIPGATLYQVGGDVGLDASEFPRPGGETDLATAVIAAARERPSLIVAITDGYENARQGDTAQVVEGLSRLGLDPLVYQVVPFFARREDLSQRSLGDQIRVLPVEHDDGVRELLARVFLCQLGETVVPAELLVLRSLLSTQHSQAS